MSSSPDPGELLRALETTWPAAAVHHAGPWLLREGQGGGKRVSAASAQGVVTGDDIAGAEVAMRRLGQRPLFVLRPEEAALDSLLAARGYSVVDPVVLYRVEAARLAGEPLPRLAVFPVWPPLAVMRDFWAEAGVGPERLAVMARAPEPRTALMARQHDRVAGVAFVACAGRVAMLHALEVTASQRRSGAGRNLMRGAAHWAVSRGADWLALAVTRDNAPARALYASLGMEPVGGYHYRIAPEEPAA